MLPGTAAALLGRRAYSVYGARLGWAEPALSPLASPLPEIDEADRLVRSRSHLQSDQALSSLHRALQIVERIPSATALSESVLSRIAFIHQQRGDFAAEDAALGAALKLPSPRERFWTAARTIARYRCERNPPNHGEQHRSLRDLAVDAVLRRCPAAIPKALAQVAPNDAASGALRLLAAWILNESGRSSEAITYLRALLDQHGSSSSSADKDWQTYVLLPARLLLAQGLGLQRSESREILEKALRISDELELPEWSAIRSDSIRLLAECLGQSGEGIVAEGLFRSNLNSLSRQSYLSEPELAALNRLRSSYANLLQQMEWNGVRRTKDAERILADSHADAHRCPFRSQDSSVLPDWIVQILLAE